MADTTEQNSLPEGEVLQINEWREPLGWILVIFMVFAGAYLLLVPASHPPRFDGPLRFVVGAGWFLFAAFLAGAIRAGVVVCSDGVLVRTLLRENSWDWKEIAEFRLRRSIYRPGLQILLQNGTEFKGLGLAGRSAEEWRLAEQMVAELNQRILVASEKGHAQS